MAKKKYSLFLNPGKEIINVVKKVSLGEEGDMSFKISKKNDDINIDILKFFSDTRTSGEIVIKNNDKFIIENDEYVLSFLNSRQLRKMLELFKNEDNFDLLINKSKGNFIEKLMIACNNKIAEIPLSGIVSNDNMIPIDYTNNVILNEDLDEKYQDFKDISNTIDSPVLNMSFSPNDKHYDVNFIFGESLDYKAIINTSFKIKNKEFNKFKENLSHVMVNEEDDFFVKYNNESFKKILSTIDKSNIKIILKNNGGLIINENKDNITINYGLIPIE